MTVDDYQRLLKCQKVFSDKKVVWPQKGEKKKFNVNSIDSKDKFYLDINRNGRFELWKVSMQTRNRSTKYPLIRICINGPTHTNPDGRKLSRNHVHLFQGDDDEFLGNLPWAIEFDEFIEIAGWDKESIRFEDFMSLIYMFCEYCNIDTSLIQGVL